MPTATDYTDTMDHINAVPLETQLMCVGLGCVGLLLLYGLCTIVCGCIVRRKSDGKDEMRNCNTPRCGFLAIFLGIVLLIVLLIINARFHNSSSSITATHHEE